MFPIARPTMVRTVTGASASKSLQGIFPLSVSNVQYSPGLRLSTGAAPAVGHANNEPISAPILRSAAIHFVKIWVGNRFGMVDWRVLFFYVFFQIHGADFGSI